MNFFSNIFNCLFQHSHYTKIIYFLYLLYHISYEYDIHELNDSYLKIKNLPSGDYLVITSKDIHYFSSDFSKDNIIYKFDTQETKVNNTQDDKKTTISEFKNNDNYYILCLVKNFLYLFDYNEMNITLVSDLNSKLSTESHYNLIPYKLIGNSLYYFISYIKKKPIICWSDTHNFYSFIFLHYKIELSPQENKNKFISENFYQECDHHFIGMYYSSYITDSIFSCHFIEKKYLVCFYLIEDSKEIKISSFNIDNNFNKEKEKDYTFKIDNCDKVNYILSSLSIKTNKIFFCFYMNYKSNYYTKCAVYNFDSNKIYTINYLQSFQNKKNFQIFYSYETASFIIFLYDDNNQLNIYN